MINILVDDNKIEISGHANSNSPGHDLVCCAVTTIIYSCNAWFKEEDINFKEEPKIPRIALTIKNINQENQNLICLVAKQLKYISEAYPKYVKYDKNRKI